MLSQNSRQLLIWTLHWSNQPTELLFFSVEFTITSFNAYMNIQLSLHEELVHLSAAAHLILAMYHNNKGEFIPVQTLFDVMLMIKNFYFCVAKTQVDNPTGSFWIILIGTDGLEKVFGKVWSSYRCPTDSCWIPVIPAESSGIRRNQIWQRHQPK